MVFSIYKSILMVFSIYKSILMVFSIYKSISMVFSICGNPPFFGKPCRLTADDFSLRGLSGHPRHASAASRSPACQRTLPRVTGPTRSWYWICFEVSYCGFIIAHSCMFEIPRSYKVSSSLLTGGVASLFFQHGDGLKAMSYAMFDEGYECHITK